MIKRRSTAGTRRIETKRSKYTCVVSLHLSRMFEWNAIILKVINIYWIFFNELFTVLFAIHVINVLNKIYHFFYFIGQKVYVLFEHRHESCYFPTIILRIIAKYKKEALLFYHFYTNFQTSGVRMEEIDLVMILFCHVSLLCIYLWYRFHILVPIIPTYPHIDVLMYWVYKNSNFFKSPLLKPVFDFWFNFILLDSLLCCLRKIQIKLKFYCLYSIRSIYFGSSLPSSGSIK